MDEAPKPEMMKTGPFGLKPLFPGGQPFGLRESGGLFAPFGLTLQQKILQKRQQARMSEDLSQ
jgi:hypothetical protein